MAKSVDEELIEATIRRVTAAAAGPAEQAEPEEAATSHVGALYAAIEAAESTKPNDALGDPTATDADLETAVNQSDGLIEATIQRVAAMKAAREKTLLTQDDEDPAHVEVDVEEPVAVSHRDGLIEGTVQRVAAMKSARENAPQKEVDDDGPTDVEVEVEEQIAAQVPRQLFARDMDVRPSAPHEEWAPHAARLERSLAETNVALASLASRLDRIAPILDRIGRGGAGAPSLRAVEPSLSEAPRPRSLPVRPAVFRDVPGGEARDEPPPAPAIDERPLPEPLPPLHVEERRGLDLLPRTYRITVEDKRRGVDLVPLHRALLSMEGVRDMSLLSYNNGVAIVSLETLTDLDVGTLEHGIARAMARDAHAEILSEQNIMIRLAAGESNG